MSQRHHTLPLKVHTCEYGKLWTTVNGTSSRPGYITMYKVSSFKTFSQDIWTQSSYLIKTHFSISRPLKSPITSLSCFNRFSFCCFFPCSLKPCRRSHILTRDLLWLLLKSIGSQDPQKASGYILSQLLSAFHLLPPSWFNPQNNPRRQWMFNEYRIKTAHEWNAKLQEHRKSKEENTSWMILTHTAM